MKETLAYLGLGTNLGNRRENLASALALISAEHSVRLIRCSRVYETEPWGMADQPPFLNCVVEVATNLDPEELLTKCKEVEQRLGRVPGPRWGPRPIDLDILLFGNQVVDLPHLQIPHSSLHLRAFVLVPLAELVPLHTHATLRRTICDLAAAVEGRDGMNDVGKLC